MKVLRGISLFVVLFLLLAIATPIMAQDSIIHIVQRGETLFRIGLRYGVTVDALMAANGLSNPHHIYVGQRLIIPTSSPVRDSTAIIHVVRPGENLFRIALRYGVSPQALAAANGIANMHRIYVGQRLRIPQTGSSAPAPAPSPPPSGQTGRWIDVDLSAQRLAAYEGDVLVRTTLVSTGLPATPTPTGRFRIYVKYPAADMSGPGYYLPDVPYTMYFYRGYGLHGTYWHNNFGHPMSHGCINLPTPEALWLFNWASVGTLVNIHY